MKNSLGYLSVFSPNELWGQDKADYCRDLIKSSKNIDALENAKEKLELYKRFDPAIPHDRTVAQRVTMSFLKNPKWLRKGKLIVADVDLSRADEGLEEKLEIDFGEKAKQISQGVPLKNIRCVSCTYPPDCFGENKIASLNFHFLSCDYSMPVIFSVLEYVAIDDEIIRRNHKIYRPAFNEQTKDFIAYQKNADNSCLKK